HLRSFLSFPTRRSSDLIELCDRLRLLPVAPPNAVTAPMHTTAIRAMSKAYSTRLAPQSPRARRSRLWRGPGRDLRFRWWYLIPRSEEHTSELQSQSNLV